MIAVWLIIETCDIEAYYVMTLSETVISCY